jgi:hypothetical protein
MSASGGYVTLHILMGDIYNKNQFSLKRVTSIVNGIIIATFSKRLL